MGAIAAAAIAAWERLDDVQGPADLRQLAETGEHILEARDRERAFKLARTGVPLASTADAFGWSLEQAE